MSFSRRAFLNTLALTSAGSLARRTFPVEIETAPAPHDPDRPGSHLLPERNWINDPCAPLYYRGQYHMFHQYNPNAAVWGDMHWAHETSPDMVHWTRQTVALAPTLGFADAQGCFTGSSLLHQGRPAVIYTGVRTVPRAEATLADGNNTFRESQILALPADDSLDHWTKHPTPVIPDPPPGLKVTGFRDPSPFRLRGRQYLIVGSGVAGKGGMILLYRAAQFTQGPQAGQDDLTRWEYLHPLLEGQWTGATGANPVDTGEMWECPDFFSLGTARKPNEAEPDEGGPYVLIYSTEGKTLWRTGRLDPDSLRFQPQSSGQLDYGRDDYGHDGTSGTFYAPKTQLDAQGNRILWGWLPETRPQAEYAQAGWSGMISLPRRLYLNHGELHMEPATELLSLRGPRNRIPNRLSSTRQEFSCVLQAANAGAATPYTLSDDFGPVLEIRSDSDSNARQDPRTVRLGGNGAEVVIHLPERLAAQAGLHLYLDSSVLEIFLDSRFCITRRFYAGGSRARSSDKPIATLTFAAPCRIVRAQSFALQSIWPR